MILADNVTNIIFLLFSAGFTIPFVYLIARKGYLNLAVIAFILITHLVVYLGSLDTNLILPFVIIPLFLASIFFSLRSFLVIAILNLGFAFLYPVLVPGLEERVYISNIYFVVVSSALILVSIKYRYDLEIEKLKYIAESKQKFSTVFDESPIGMALVGPNYAYVDVNKAFADMLDYTKKELLSLKFTDITHPEDLESDLQESKKLFSGEISSYSIEKRYLKRNGDSIWTELTARTVLDRDSGEIFGVAMIEDITERRKYVKALEDAEEESRKLVEFFPDGILIHRDEQIVYVNKAAADIFGYANPEEVIGKDVFDLIHPDDQKKARKRVKILNKGEEPPEEELRLVRPDSQSTAHVQVKSRPIEYEGTKAIQVAVRDVTSYKAVERGLIKAKQQAEESRKVKERFIANMSHEIRTPMNAVLGMAHLLKDTKLDIQQEDYIQIINNSAENLLVIINDILDISKIEAGKIQFNIDEFSIEEIVKNVINTVELDAKKKGLQLEYNLDTGIPLLLIGDRVRLSQILLNLVANAIKFTSSGGVRLEVNQINRTKTSVTVRFTVIDTGIGIAEKDLNTIFDSFTRAEGASGYGGTGLGLTIVKRLVELQKGTITVESELGVGTTFEIELTFGRTDENYLNKISKRSQKSIDDFSNRKVLIVEDNKINQLILKKLLEKYNINADIANDGIEALELVKKEHYELILMDIKMPNMNGFETTKEIRNIKEYKEIPIIGVSAHAMVEEKDKALRSGMDDYITKPIVPSELLQKLNKYLND